jgi:hypothetical protein
MFEKRVLRRIFGQKRDEVMGVWRTMRKEELSDLYCSSSIITIIKSKRMRWSGACSSNGGEEESVKFTCGKARGKDTTRKTNMWVGG